MKYCSNLEESDYDDIWLQKAIFYGDEYEESLKKSDKGQPFDLNSKYYYNDNYCRDMDRIREWVISKITANNIEYKDYIKGLPNKRKYTERQEYAEKKQINKEGKRNNVELKFRELHMKQIYKMTFDRLKNVQLVSNLILMALTILAVVLVGLSSNSEMAALSSLPKSKYSMVTLMIIIITGIVNICQAFNVKYYDRVVAEMGYKSGFVNGSEMDTFTLNELLVKDIATGYVQTIDIERGTTRYQGSVISKVIGESNDERSIKIDFYNQLNRPLLHFKQQAYKRHTEIMSCSIFLILFAVLVWMYGLYWTFFPLMFLSIVAHFLALKYILPNFGKKKLIRYIERCISKYEIRQRELHTED